MKSVTSLMLSVLLFGAIFALSSTVVVADSTIVIDGTGGDCASVGVWDDSTKTCTLTNDVFETIVIDGDWITLDGNGHTVMPGYDSYGVVVSSHSGNTIKKVIVTESDQAIRLEDSDDNLVTENDLTENLIGIHVSTGSEDNTITENTVTNHQFRGMFLQDTTSNTVTENEFSGNYMNIHVSTSANDNEFSENKITYGKYGFYMIENTGNSVLENEIWDNMYGIYMVKESSDNLIAENHVFDNSFGIWLYMFCTGNVLVENLIDGNLYGNLIMYVFSGGNIVIENTISGSMWGVDIYLSSGNSIFHNNIVDNTYQLSEWDATNIWDDGAGEGNYWSDYAGEDLDGDGVGDTDLPHQGADWYPLMSPC